MPRPTLAPGSLLGLVGVLAAHGEIESTLAPADDLLFAGTRPNPEQIGPIIRHHHEHQRGLAWELELTAGADSRYVSEGRDNLPDERGIVWGAATGHIHALGGSLFAEAIAITGWEANYREFGMAAGYEFESGPLTVGASAAYLWFPADDEEDFELGLSARVLLGSGLGLAADGYWSNQSDGWFGEGKMFLEVRAGEVVTIIPTFFVGINQGYVPGEHDGLNHAGCRLTLTWSLTEQLEASAYAAASKALDERPGETLEDLFWIGTAVIYSF